MSLLPPAIRVLRNTLLVALAVVLGFLAGDAMGMPVWAQGFCLLPAAVLFFHLAGRARPAWWRMLAFFTVMSIFTGVFTYVLPLIPQRYQTLAFVFLIMLSPITPVARWLTLPARSKK